MDALDSELIAAIAAAPDDDAPRLVYADRLAERGEPRGELIVLQCQLARLRRGRDPARWEAIDTRIRELLAAHERRWRAETGLPAWLALDWTWRRGFVEAIRVNPRGLVEHADSVFAALPLLRALRVGIGPTYDAAPVLALPQLARLDALDLSDARVTAHDLRAFASDPRNVGLRELQLNRTWIGTAELDALLASPLRLRALYLSRTNLERDAIAALATASAMVGLETLCATHVALGDDIADALARLPRLARLMITHADLTTRSVCAIAERLPYLTMLQLDDRTVLAPAATALARHGALRELYVSRAELGDDGVVAIAWAEGLAELAVLALESVGASDAAAHALAEAPGIGELDRLWLRWNAFGDAAKVRLVERFGSRVVM